MRIELGEDRIDISVERMAISTPIKYSLNQCFLQFLSLGNLIEFEGPFDLGNSD